jgi:hypothetical protein
MIYEIKEQIKSTSHNAPFTIEDGYHWPKGARFQTISSRRAAFYKRRYSALVGKKGIVLEQIGGEEVVVLVNEQMKSKFQKVKGGETE